LQAALSYYRQLYQAAITRTFPVGPITTPALSLFGANDPTAKYAHLEEPVFQGLYRRVVLPDVGHFPHLDSPEQVDGLILDWLAAHRTR